jgi:hypothetical protein
MKLGTENKKATVALSGLLLVLAYFFYSNVLSGPSASSDAPRTVAPAAAADPSPLVAPPVSPTAARRPQASRSAGAEFHPVLRSTHPEERIDPMTVDPTLHLELLKKLQEAAGDTGGRNLFQFGPPPPPPPTPEQIAKLNHPEPVVTPQPQNVAPAGPPPPPPPPPISLKYYGLSTARANGKKVAFFMDGEAILMAGEGEMLQKRYRVVRIGVNSVVLEDTQLKREQSVPLASEPNG